MPVRMEWLNEEKTLIYAKIDGRPEDKEYFDADVEFRAMLASVPHPVDLIEDLTKLAYYSSSYTANMAVLRSFARPNLRSVIFMGRFGWELFEAYIRIHGGSTYQCAFAESLEDAYTLISRIRAGELLQPSRPASPDWN